MISFFVKNDQRNNIKRRKKLVTVKIDQSKRFNSKSIKRRRNQKKRRSNFLEMLVTRSVTNEPEYVGW